MYFSTKTLREVRRHAVPITLRTSYSGRFPPLDIFGRPSTRIDRFWFAAALFCALAAAPHVGVGSGPFSAVLYVALLGVMLSCTVALPSRY